MTLLGLTCVCFLCPLVLAEEQKVGLMIVPSEEQAAVVEEEEQEEEKRLADPFIPTKEWQEIQPGQGIPRGLHVRINLQTGKKEAKLMGADILAQGSKEKSEVKFLKKELEEALKHLEDDQRKTNLGSLEESGESRFRSIDEIKREFEALKMDMKSETEIVNELLDEFSALHRSGGEKSSGRKTVILKDLAYHVHQYDVARDFTQNGGFHKVVLPCFNASEAGIRREALAITAAAMQSNPMVQIAGLEANFIPEFLRLLQFDPSQEVRRVALSALSSLVRGFPLAQLRLFQAGAVHVFVSVFSTRNDHEGRRLQVKIVTLIQDLLVERTTLNTSDVERAKQYSELDLEEVLHRSGLCSLIPPLLNEPLERDKRGRRMDLGAARNRDIPLRPEHDTIEKVLQAMSSLCSFCALEFRPSLPLLHELQLMYSELSNKEEKSSGEYFGTLATLSRDIIRRISVAKEEL